VFLLFCLFLFCFCLFSALSLTYAVTEGFGALEMNGLLFFLWHNRRVLRPMLTFETIKKFKETLKKFVFLCLSLSLSLSFFLFFSYFLCFFVSFFPPFFFSFLFLIFFLSLSFFRFRSDPQKLLYTNSFFLILL